MKKYLLISTLLIFGLQNIKGQNNIIHQPRFQQNNLVNYSYAPRINASEIIRGISVAMQRNNYSLTEYQVMAEMEGRILQEMPGRFKITLQGKNLYITGDRVINGFNMDDVMSPDLFSFDISISLPGFNNRFTRHYTQVSAINNGMLANDYINDTISWNGARMELNNFSIYYSRDAINRFNNKIRLIDNYNKLNALYYINRLKGLPWNNMDSFETLSRELNIANIYYREQNSMEFNNLSADPNRKLSDLNELGLLVQRLNGELAFLQSRIPYIFYEKGIIAMNSGYYNDARVFFRKAEQNHPSRNFSPAIIRTADVDLIQSIPDSAAYRLLSVQRSVPDSVYNYFIQVSKKVFDNMVQVDKNWMASNQFNRIETRLKTAENLCSTIPFDANCGEKIKQAMNQVSEARFLYYYTLSTKARQEKNYTVAMQFADSCTWMEVNYSNFLTTTGRSEKLIREIVQKKFSDVFEKGNIAWNQKKYAEACQHYFDADKTAKKYNLTTDKNYQNKIRQAAIWYYNDALKQLENDYKGMSLQNARETFSRLTNETNGFGIQSEVEIKKRIQSLSTRLISKECEEHSQLILNIIARASQSETDRNYTQAGNVYMEAMMKAREKSYCMFDTNSLYIKQQRIVPAIQFEKNMEQIHADIRLGEYDKAIQKLKDLIKYYNENKIRDFGKDSISLSKWPLEQVSDPYFLFRMADYFTVNFSAESMQALSLLNKALLQGMAYKMTRSVQEELGRQRALEDHKIKGNSPKIWVQEYVKSTGSKMKYFKKSYLKYWKELDKNK